jgi:hypothetical protein
MPMSARGIWLFPILRLNNIKRYDGCGLKRCGQ